MINLISAAILLGFVAMALPAVFFARSQDEARARGHVNRFLAYTMVFSLVAGGLHLELWPFSRWNIFSLKLEQPVYQILVFAIDTSGREHDVDRRAFEPFTSLDLYTWLDFSFAALPPGQQREAGAYLLEQLNAARARAAAGERVGRFDRVFGRFSAPVHLLHAPLWNDRARVPPLPFAGLRVYRERWNVFDESRAPGARTRELLYDHQAAGTTP